MSTTRNVVLIMTDQQHFRTLGCHGATEARTPNIDALSANGTVFANHIVANPVCSPSRASIMTGKHITEHGLWANGCELPDAYNTTIPQAMGAAGWQTAHFGKLHLWPIITRTEDHPPYGFDVCEVAEGDQQLLQDEHFTWLRKNDPDLFVTYVTEMFNEGHAKAYTSKMPEEKHLSTWVTDRSIDWLRDRRAGDKPFFLSVGYFDPHHAFNPCEPYASMFADAEVAPPRFREGENDARPEHYAGFYNGCKGVTRDDEKIIAIIRAYHAMVAHIDTCVGRIVAALSELGLADDTVVVFTSDHGEFLGNHGLLWKGPYLLDDLVRVPLVVSVPGAKAPPRRTDELTSGVDIMATVLNVSGAREGAWASGRSALGNDLSLFPDGTRDSVLVEWEHFKKEKASSSLRCIRTKTHKLVHYNTSDEGELYDLAADPDEFENRYDDPACADVRRDLYERLSAQYLTRVPDNPHRGGW